MKPTILLCTFLFVTTIAGQTGILEKKAYLASSLTTDEKATLSELSGVKGSVVACGQFLLTGDACKDLNGRLAKVYETISQSPSLVRYLTAEAVSAYQSSAGNTKSAMQVSQIVDQQNAELLPLLIIQNQRIIELLEAIARKPK